MTLKLLESMQLEKFIKAELWWRQLAASHLSALPSSTVWLIIGESWVCHGSKKLEIFWEFRRLFFWQIKQHFLIAFASLGTTVGADGQRPLCASRKTNIKSYFFVSQLLQLFFGYFLHEFLFLPFPPFCSVHFISKESWRPL